MDILIAILLIQFRIYMFMPGRMVYDPQVGYRNAPGDWPFENTEFKTVVHIGPGGYRGEEVEEPEILVAGDSFSFGWGVHDSEVVSARIAQLTGKRVLNTSVAGYGTVQEYLSLVDWDDDECIGFVFFFDGNDIDDNNGYNVGPTITDDGEIEQPDTARFNAYAEIEQGKAGITDVLELFYAKLTKYSSLRNRWTATRLAIEKLAALEMRIVIVYVPAVQWYMGHQGLKVVHDSIYAISTRYGLEFADLVPVLTRADYYNQDPHWNASGHMKVAQYLRRFVHNEN